MKTIIALHGNPGAPEDWNVLQQQLNPAEYTLKAFSSYGTDWIDEVRKGADQKILLAHSWGTYPVLKNLKRLESHVEKVVLVCPYAKPEKPLPAAAGVLMRLPFIGDALIKSSHQKMLNVFVAEMIQPQKMTDLPYYQQIQDRFKDWRRWQKAALAKLDMQKDPWEQSWITNVPMTLLFGSEDKTSTVENQNNVFKNYAKATTKIIPNAGHGILWSHPAEIIAAIK